MTFAIQVRDWLIHVVWVRFNQSRTRIIKEIRNSENRYVIHLLRIINIQIMFLIIYCIVSVNKAEVSQLNYVPHWDHFLQFDYRQGARFILN